MAKVKILTDALTRERYYLELKSGRAFRRITAGIGWPEGGLPGALVVLGETRARQNALDGLHEGHVLDEYQTGSAALLAAKAADLQGGWYMRSWAVAPDPRSFLLDDEIDRMRTDKRRSLHYHDPMGWIGKGEGTMPFYFALAERRTRREGKSLYYGPGSYCATEITRIAPQDMRSRPTDFPAAAALFFALADMDVDRMPEWEDRRPVDAGPADELGGY